MTIKKNTIIIICSIIIVFVISVYFINNTNVIQFKDNSSINEKQETTNNSENINTSNKKDKQVPITNGEEPVSSTDLGNGSNNNIDTNTNANNNDQPLQIEPSAPNKEEEVLNYFRLLESDTEKSTKEGRLDKVKNKLDSAFFTTVDFIFYDKEVKGVTFDELSHKAKVEILEMASNIDSMITKKFPTYKETIKDSGSKVYGFVNEQISNLKIKIKNEIGNEKYNNILETIEKGKNKIIDFKDKAVDVKDNVVDKLKDWYENKREN